MRSGGEEKKRRRNFIASALHGMDRRVWVDEAVEAEPRTHCTVYMFISLLTRDYWREWVYLHE